MQSMGEMIKTFMPELTLGSESHRYTCEGCGNEVVVMEMPILGGPNKGHITTQKKGCVCWENEQAEEAKRYHKKMIIDKMVGQHSTVNPDLEVATFENYQPSNAVLEQALSIARDYALNFDIKKPMNLLFSGMYGLGKSHLSYAICKTLISKGHTAIFVSVPKLLTIIKSTYNQNSQFSEAELLKMLSETNFLVLDDIGAEKVNKGDTEGDTWATEKLFEIIDGRSGRHTLYTTNLSSADLSKKVGPRNFSRMMMNTRPFKFEGDDYRLKNIIF